MNGKASCPSEIRLEVQKKQKRNPNMANRLTADRNRDLPNAKQWWTRRQSHPGVLSWPADFGAGGVCVF